VSVRNQRYRLDAAGKLYDIKSDPGQEKDVAADHPEVVQRMKTAAGKFIAEVKDQIGPDDRPFPVGHSASTPLPARDGVAHGSVQRSGRAPNCSYFLNWSKPGDKITWDVEVAEAGDYEVVIFHACPPADVGATFEVSHNDARMTAKVTGAHDPPAYGMEKDRTPNRGSESYVKDFKPMSFGTITLKKGRGPLTLRAVEVPGKQVMEVRLLFLNRK
ncbi:MAG: N-acetylgalactosamine 6-sulfate sulfatase, partial [Akkermansiaceae bacterium]|nr:N-acetylgalactosamine 6-sulfate sulfatase [Akkermansiaceae bacterium]